MRPGLGVMIQAIGGDRGEDPSTWIGKTIKEAKLIDNEIQIKFEDDTGVKVIDDGQSCCESRYITTDDDLTKLSGQVLTGIIEKPAEDRSGTGDYDDSHEVAFVEICTPSTTVTLETHVEHNGYYGGFWLKVQKL